MKKISCIFGQHRYRPSEIEFYLAEKKPNSNVYRSIAKCMYCGKNRRTACRNTNTTFYVGGAERSEDE